MRDILISANSLNNSACMRKYDWAKNRRLQPNRRGEALEKGDMLHQMLAHYYRMKMQGGHPHMEMIDASIEAGRRAVIEMDLDLNVSEEEVVKAFREYCIFWQNDPWIPIAVEAPFSYVLYENEEQGVRVIDEGKIDLIIANPLQEMKKLLVDHKSGSRNSTPTGLSNQFMGYCDATNANVAVLNRIGFQKTLPPEKKFVRHILQYPTSVIEDWRRWAIWRALYIDSCNQSGTFPPDFTSCDKYGGCEFAKVCMAEVEAREFHLSREFKVVEHSIYDKGDQQETE